jgi:hypothetical protein
MKTTAKTFAVWSLVAALLVGMSLASGCALDEIVKVDVPPNTREHYRENLDTSVPPKVSLRDARILRSEGDRKFKASIEGQVADHAASNDALDAEIADGSFIEGLLGSAVNTGVEMALPGLGAVPGGAVLTTLIAGLGMWLVPRPGEKKKVAEAKSEVKQAEDHGYDMGRAEALDTLARADR